MHDVVVIGGGPAGLTASLYCARYMLDTLLITKELGGTALKAYKIENYPGFLEISGIELAQRIELQVRKAGAKIVTDEVLDVKRTAEGFRVLTSTSSYGAKALIVAVGKVRRKLGVPGEEELVGRGVSYCATCDAPLFKEKVVCVVGGGDSALKSALLLAEHAKLVYLVHRRGSFRAEPLLVRKVEENERIRKVLGEQVTEILGEDRVEGIRLKSGRVLRVDGVFIEIGGEPPKDFLRMLGLELDERGFVKVSWDMSTNVPGIFACGDVISPFSGFNQIVLACATGAVAAHSAYKYLR